MLHHPILLEEPENLDLVAAALEKVTAVFASGDVVEEPEGDEPVDGEE